ncbi:hypothetical protein PFISCL1PPCAC_16830, partial [Pristionchus fissidentatus]
TLEFGEVALTERDFWTRQASDGTMFYVTIFHGNDSSIYVLYKGDKVTAINSWDGEISGSECFGNTLYFKTGNNKIHTATFHPPSEIQIKFIRDLEKKETCDIDMLMRRTINYKEVIYRACDDPTKGIIVDVTEEKLRGTVNDVLAIHR